MFTPFRMTDVQDKVLLYFHNLLFFPGIIFEKMICYLTMDILQNQDPQSLSPKVWGLNGVYHTTLFWIF